MRHFSDEEKKIIRALVNGVGFDRNLINIMGDEGLEDVLVSVDSATLDAKFLFESFSNNLSEDQIQSLRDKYSKIAEKIILHVGLFRYLENNNLEHRSV